MAINDIVGRDSEKKLLKELYEKKEKTLFLFYGRRRIGKSWLVTKYFEDKEDCFFLFFKAEYELREQPETQSYNMRTEINKALSENKISYKIKFNSKEPLWAETFRYVQEGMQLLLENYPNKKIVIFFDELPWFYTQEDKTFVGVLSSFWSNYVSRNKDSAKIKIFGSGSATRSLLSDLVKAKGALFQNSNSRQMFPFTLKETKIFLEKNNKVVFKNNEDLLRLFFAVGGVADYLKIKPDQTVDDFIQDFYFVNPNNYNMDLDDFLDSSFDGHEHHRLVLDIINLNKDVTKTKIHEALKSKGKSLDGTGLNTVLSELEKTGLVLSTEPFYPSTKVKRKLRTSSVTDETKEPRNKRYKIIDEMVLFHYYWLIGKQRNKNLLWDLKDPLQKDWKGKLFEIACHKHFDYILEAKKYAATTTYDIHFWQNENAEIDLLVDRDKVIDILEMKCYDNGYEMPNSYMAELTNKKVQLSETIQGYKLKYLNSYKKKEILITLITSSTFVIPDEYRSREKIAAVINFSELL